MIISAYPRTDRLRGRDNGHRAVKSTRHQWSFDRVVQQPPVAGTGPDGGRKYPSFAAALEAAQLLRVDLGLPAVLDDR
jgi:hypothetical protein